MQILPPNVWIFHLANAFLLLSYLLTDILFLRICLALAGLCFTFWGALLLVPGAIALDTVIWNAIFVIINTLQAIRIIYSRRPIKFKEKIHESIFESVFLSFGVSRLEFLSLMEASTLTKLNSGDIFVNDGDITHNLSILQSGKLLKYKTIDGKEMTVNKSYPFEFVESPEWCLLLNKKFQSKPTFSQSFRQKSFRFLNKDKISVTEIKVGETNEALKSFVFMNVSVKALEDCEILQWSIENLSVLLQSSPHLAGAFSSIIAVDVAEKLFRQTGSTFSSKEILNRITNSREIPNNYKPNQTDALPL